MRWMVWLAVVSLLVFPASTFAETRCFPETGFCIDGRIREYWEQNGGLEVFGYPLNNARLERNRDTGEVYLTQWFERNRFEVHPENQAPYDVLLGRLGAELITAPPAQAEAAQADCLWFDVTQLNVCNQAGNLGFMSYWQNHGLQFDGAADFAESLALFGYPLSTARMETNSSGDTVLTQWFERARFEWHPNNPDEFKVLLGRLGAEGFDPARATGEIPYVWISNPDWGGPLRVPLGFTVEEVASDLNGPRFMALDPADNSLVVAQFHTNVIDRLRDTNNDGRYDQRQRVADGFTVMHSVAFVDGALYAADERGLYRLSNFDSNGRAQTVTTLLDLPTGATDLYGHKTRTIEGGPDGKLYLSIGSSCDVCIEDHAWRATILRLDQDGSNVEVWAAGLRNTVGFTWHPYTGALWGVDMGRNNIGLDEPADELNLLEQGQHYGWPWCHSTNQPNPEFGDPALCQTPQAPALKLPAHWSPLGIMFYDGFQFPPAYQGDAFVAFHGSGAEQVGNQLSGYEVARIHFNGQHPHQLESFVAGWLKADGSFWGRPAGLEPEPGGSLLVSDDFSGRIYRVRYVGR